jgi:predicted PurR-regulated permease PerM
MGTAAEARITGVWVAVCGAAIVGLWTLRELVMLVAFAILLAYLLDPLVNRLQRVPLPRGQTVTRGAASVIVILAMLIGIGWGLSVLLPQLAVELGHFVQGLPGGIEALIADLRARATSQGLGRYVDPALDLLRGNAQALLQGGGSAVFGWIGRMFSGLLLVGVAVLPLLAFYLLAEREDVKKSAMQFMPETAHAAFERTGLALDRALRSYVRGQSLVCLIMGTAVGVVLAIMGFPMTLLLGVIVGLAEMIPYLGFMVAAVAIAVAGITIDPTRAALGVLAYVVLNNVIGILVTPRVMGRHLKMHPFVVTISILAGGQLLGPAGALLALPAAASAQALIEEFGPAKGRRSRAK